MTPVFGSAAAIIIAGALLTIATQKRTTAQTDGE
jgi:hypothetical protein